MTVAVAHPSGHSSHATRWLIAAVIVLAAALVALGIYTLVHEEPAAVKPAATTTVESLDQGQMQAFVMNKADAQNAYDAARIATFYAPNAVFYDTVTGTRIAGGPTIGKFLAAEGKKWQFAYRVDGGPYVVGSQYVVVPFSLVSQKNATKVAGVTQRIDVLKMESGKIVSNMSYGLYTQ